MVLLSLSRLLPLPWERRSPAQRGQREGDTYLSPGAMQGQGSGYPQRPDRSKSLSVNRTPTVWIRKSYRWSEAKPCSNVIRYLQQMTEQKHPIVNTDFSDTKKVFRKCGTCSSTFFHILDREFYNPEDREGCAADLLAGGLRNTGHQS